MIHKPRVLIIGGYGFNCEEETAFAFSQAGGNADILHVNDLLASKKKLNEYQILTFPGGFSFGDDTGSGNAMALKIKNNYWESLLHFIEHDHLMLGICNGFQVLVRLGLLPGIDGLYGEEQAALTANDSVRYMVRWTDLKVHSDTPWLRGIDTISLPIAHGEGKFYVPLNTLEMLKKNKQIALRYTAGEMSETFGLPVNPTGTLDNIAGITDPTHRILGIMPHPERAIFFTQLPHWTLLRERLHRSGKHIPVHGPGIRIFKNAISYFG